MAKKFIKKFTSIFKDKQTKKFNLKKLGVFIIVALVFISIIPWIVSDYKFNNSTSTKWVKVGKKYTESNLILNDFNNAIYQNSAQLQQNPYAAFSILNSVISRYVTSLVFANEAERLKFKLSDEQLVKIIASVPAFQNQSGKFDIDQFREQLRRIFGSEEAFLDNIKNEILKEQVTRPLNILNSPSNIVGYTNYLFFDQSRIVKVININPSLIKEPLEKAKEEDLNKLLQDNKEQFTQPIKYSGGLLIYEASQFENQIKITESEVKEYYNNNQSNYIDEEKRSFQQVNFSSEEEALEAEKRISTPEDIEKIKNDYTVITFEKIIMSEVENNIAKEVFKLKANQVSKAFKSDIGWHIVVVKEVFTSKAKPLSAVYQEVKNDLWNTKYTMYANNIKNQIRNSDNDFKTLAKNINAKYIPFEKQEFGSVTRIINNRSLLDEINSVTKSTRTSLIEDEQGNILIAKIDEVIPEKLSDVSEVKPVLLEIWNKNKREEALTKIYSQIILDVSNGQDINKLGYKVNTLNIDLLSNQYNLSMDSLEQIFLNEKGKAFLGTYSNGNLFVALVTNINKSKAILYDKETKIYNQKTLDIVVQMNPNYSQGLLETYSQFIQSKYKITINQEAILNTLNPQE